jgi:biopolymer transport protein ExbD
VDLGFLLITFFMMTTTMAKPRAMNVQMPSTEHTQTPTVFYESSAITLIPASKHVIYYYEGIFNPTAPFKKVTNAEGIRKMLTAKKASLSHREKIAERELQVIIKSHPSSTVNDIIALLDEMKIDDVKYYAMEDISAEESLLIN